MSAAIVIGADRSGAPIRIDIEELLATRLLVQGNSGSGKSHLLRRLLEQSANLVQQVVIDPEGDFVSLADRFGHVVVDGSAYDQAEIVRIAARIRTHRASVILALDGLEIESQMRCAAMFLNTLFDAPRDEWYPALVVVDEAQMFAPAAAGDVADDVRRLSLAAMTNLMCRGRKRGLAGVIATQRLAKLAKNVAAEASNFLMGRTFLDIDMARAADLLGMERKQAETIRDLERGHFLGLGPAIARRPVSVRIADVETRARNVVHGLMPLPNVAGSEMEDLLLTEVSMPEMAPRPAPVPEPVVDAGELLEQIEDSQPLAEQVERPVEPSLFEAEENASAIVEILAEMAVEPDCTFQPAAQLFQDFTVRCRMARITNSGIDLAAFRRRFAMAIAGIPDDKAPQWREIVALSADVPDDLLAPFLVLAVAASEGAVCPDDDRLAEVYGTRSSGRIRRLLDHLERQGLIVVRTDYGGRRSVGIPALGLLTQPA
ncbi:ATPase [Novosphingobium nitrogenifigens DSM 19370]|uniref:ATPase n=1 Tax=Novosphingobium nitrogenifigens DSM 19370 TaxID=983920 RepID=F1ZAD2_9SPHN|nr:ATP-binding protein [Novosphingobium nitrogenifigens]EGD58460.1 ATPase [Novosphingobium nitrogenifigens DSM 19370]